MKSEIVISKEVFFGIPVIFYILFTVLKLTGVIAWSWLWVMCPLWLLPAFIAVFLICILCFIIICFVIAGVLSLFP